MTYYNDNEPFAVAWMRELMKAGEISEGVVDERDVWDIVPNELRQYERVHLFAGIGGWDYALRLAAWTGPVWTISCPCQPFSAAGKGYGFADKRHIWPAAFHLIDAIRPGCIFGEQVTSRDGLAWLDLVFSDLEGAGYTTGAIDFCAAGVGAPHIRQRLYFVAIAKYAERWTEQQAEDAGSGRSGSGGGRLLGDTCGTGLERWISESADDGAERAPIERASTNARGVVNAKGECGQVWSTKGGPEGRPPSRGAVNGFWSDAEWLWCRDKKYRPAGPGIFPLAYGIPNRVGTLRGAGNAIVPWAAAAFVRSVAVREWRGL